MQRLCGAAALALIALAATLAVGCASGGLFQQYEYEEDVYLSLDGTATVYVNSSVPALNALRGASLDTTRRRGSTARPSESSIRRRSRTSAGYSVAAERPPVSPRAPRRRRRAEARCDCALSVVAYEFRQQGDLYVYLQTIGASVKKNVGDVGWKGDELVAFRLHLPSKIAYHNAGAGNPKRGNILVWEQKLSDRLLGKPLVLDARMQTQSILYRTLLLFAATFVAVAVTFAIVIVAVLRWDGKGRGRLVGQEGQGRLPSPPRLPPTLPKSESHPERHPELTRQRERHAV